MAAVAAKIEDEQSLGIKMQKQVKELSVSCYYLGYLLHIDTLLLHYLLNFWSNYLWFCEGKFTETTPTPIALVKSYFFQTFNFH